MSLLEAIRRKYTEQQRDMERALSGGGAKDYLEYKFIVGRIQGMADLMREVEGVLARSEQDLLDDTEV